MTLLHALTDFFVLQAGAEEAAGPQGPLGTVIGFLPYVLMFGVLYVLMIRPASKQRKEQQEMLSALKKSDEVMTSSGICGVIQSIDEQVVTLEIADKVKIRILRDRIAGPWRPTNANPSTQNASATK